MSCTILPNQGRSLGKLAVLDIGTDEIAQDAAEVLVTRVRQKAAPSQ